MHTQVRVYICVCVCEMIDSVQKLPQRNKNRYMLKFKQIHDTFEMQ